MNFVRIDPPGSFCFYEAVFDMLGKSLGSQGRARRIDFVEVGCGAGDLSKRLCQLGQKGVGLDFSQRALDAASENLSAYIANGAYELRRADLMVDDLRDMRKRFDVAMSMMVMEHVRDDVGFLRNLSRLVKPGGYVMVAVPGRMERWSIEDDTVGHLRRYSREDLAKRLDSADLADVVVWSVAVPVANMLFHLSNFLVARSAESQKVTQSQREQTETSGIREIPFKTVFPPFFRLLLNRTTLSPLFLLQRMFYGTGLGLTMLAAGRVR